MRSPRLVLAAFLLALIVLAGTSAYAGYLVVGMVAGYFDIGRFAAGLLLGLVFLRLPRVRSGKFSSVGLLPKKVRLPVILALLVACMLLYVQQRNLAPVLFLGLAAVFLLTFRWLRQAAVNRLAAFGFKATRNSTEAKPVDPMVIDVDVREKKD